VPSAANLQQTEHWNLTGRAWVEHAEPMDRFLAPITAALMEAAALRPGERALDIGCGCGTTSLEAARRVGLGGEVLAIDISEPMLARARERAAEAGTANLQFVAADAQTADLGQARFDVALSRFGVMFFEDPQAAFANIRGAMRPGGRLAFICWRAPAENPFFAATGVAAAPLLPPAPPPDPTAPGQFSFADAGRVRTILEGSGWREIDVGKLDAPTAISEDEAMRLLLGVGPAAAAVREDPSLRPKLAEAMGAALAPYRNGGVLRLTAACWLVKAAA
jgi:SAM-dependent methyltransferase